MAGYSTKSLEKQRAVEDKICNYQSTNREKALKRELKRLQDFHSFLVSHIDGIGQYSNSKAIARETQELKVLIGTALQSPNLKIENVQATIARTTKKKCKTKTTASQTDKGVSYGKRTMEGPDTIVVSRNHNMSSLPTIVSNTEGKKQRLLEEQEVHAAFQYANENFGKMYREVEQKNSDLMEKLLERDNELLELRLQLQRVKHMEPSAKTKQIESTETKREIELLKLRLCDQMDENKRLRKRLNRNKIRAVILERQKKEIIRLKSDRKGQLLAQRNIGRDTYVRDDMLIGSPLETRSKGAQRSKAIAPSISLRKDSNLKRHNYNSQKMSHAFSGGNLIIRNSSGL
eukprot:g6854.t1